MEQFAQQTNIENDKFPIELTNTTGTYLQHLNDDCLLKLFSVKSLTLMDLCSLVDTCKRFSQIIRLKDLRIDIWSDDYDVTSRKYLHSENRSLPDVQRIFKKFGSGLSDVSIINYCRKKPSDLMVKLVSEYCVVKLERLKIDCAEIPAVVIVELKPILKRLQILDLEDVSIAENPTLFADLDSLIELRVCGVKNDNAILKNIFPKLERFIYHADECRSVLPLETFISCHQTLKKLKIFIRIDLFKMKFVQVIARVIANSCNELEELEIHMGQTIASYLQPLQALQSLTILKLISVTVVDLEFITELLKLRELHLIDCSLPKLSTLAASTQLRQLNIIGGNISPAFDLVDLVRRLANLDELTISGAYSGYGDEFLLDEETFSKIVDVLEGRSNVLKLNCECNFVSNLASCVENHKVALMRY